MSRALLVAFVAAAIVFGLGIASPRAAGQAPVPIHDVGDAVGFGASMNLGELAEPLLMELRALDEADDNITLNRLNFTGSADIWVAMEVVEKTSTYYGIQEDSAAGVSARFVVNATSTQFPQEGTHPGTIDPTYGCIPPLVPYATETTSADVQIAYLSSSSGLSRWTVSEFALLESRTNYSLDTRITSSLRNIPSLELNLTACEVVVTYEDSDVTFTADIDAEIRAIYGPALDYFDFLIADGETWYAFSNATVAGRIRGTIDATGLDPDEEQEFFDSLNEAVAAMGLTVTGLTGFPIVLEDITVAVGLDTYLQDGVIDDIPVPVALSLSARQATMTLADGQFHTVYLIAEAPVDGFAVAPCSWVYSPDDGFIVGYICELQPGYPFFELENVEPGAARQEISDTKTNYAIGPAPNPLADFFLKAPFFGLILIAAAVIVVAALLMRRRRRPAMAPPMPPEAPPPEMRPPESPPPETP